MFSCHQIQNNTKGYWYQPFWWWNYQLSQFDEVFVCKTETLVILSRCHLKNESRCLKGVFRAICQNLSFSSYSPWMYSPLRSSCTLLVVLLTLGLFFVVYIHVRTISLPTYLHVFNINEIAFPLAKELSSYKGKPFVYLVQAESCLSQHLRSFVNLESSTERDFIVLSWGQECFDLSTNISGVMYVNYRNTTWSSGRNILYGLALNKKVNYRYYIFLDEDIEFSFTANTSQDFYSTGTKHPLKAFENFLLSYEPALGLCNYCSRCGKPLADGSYVSGLCCSPRPTNGDLPPLLPVSISFDAAVNAFHTRAIKYILPYRLDYENISWWESQKYVILASDILFRGQVVRYTPVTATNNNHNDYPQQLLDNWADILEDIRKTTPKQFKNQSVFNREPIVDMVPEVVGNVVHTLLWNLSIPEPKTPIIPYRHFHRYREH